MNSLERAIAAIKHEKIDRVPTDLHNFELCARTSGEPYDRFLKSGFLMAEWQIAMWQRFGHDVILHENGTCAMAETVGCKVEYRKDLPPAVVAPALNSIKEVGKLKPFHLSNNPVIQELLKGSAILQRQIGDRVLIMGRSDIAPFSLAALMLGMENFLMETVLKENEEDIHHLLTYCTDATLQFIKAQFGTGILVTSLGDSTAGPDLVSPEVYREFAFPYEKAIVDEVHSRGGLMAVHICGNATKILPDMVATQADILEIDEKTDLRTAVSLARNKSCLLGTISPNLLRNGNAAEVAQTSQEVLQIAGKETGFIFGPGCALAGDTPFENIDALLNAVRI